MSRTTYLDYRAKLSRPVKKIKFTFAETLAFVQRSIKRQAIAAGHIEDPAQRPPEFEWHWQLDDPDLKDLLGGIVLADTRSQAKAKIKRELNLKTRLPQNIQIVRQHNAGLAGSPSATA